MEKELEILRPRTGGLEVYTEASVAKFKKALLSKYSPSLWYKLLYKLFRREQPMKPEWVRRPLIEPLYSLPILTQMVVNEIQRYLPGAQFFVEQMNVAPATLVLVQFGFEKYYFLACMYSPHPV